MQTLFRPPPDLFLYDKDFALWVVEGQSGHIGHQSLARGRECRGVKAALGTVLELGFSLVPPKRIAHLHWDVLHALRISALDLPLPFQSAETCSTRGTFAVLPPGFG